MSFIATLVAATTTTPTTTAPTTSTTESTTAFSITGLLPFTGSTLITTGTTSVQPTTQIVVISVTLLLEPTVPLTTTFTPPSSCLGRYYTITASEEPVIWSGALDRLYTDCQPNASTTIFSPGMCPGHMTSVSVGVSGAVFTDVCCQSGFSWDFRGCSSAVSTATDVLVAPAVSTQDSTTRVSRVVATHQAITVLWQDADLSLFPTDLASRRRLVEASLLGTSTMNITTTPDPGSSASQTGLSKEARIGIGVGLGFGALLVTIAIAAWLLRARRKRQMLGRAPRGDAQELDASNPLWKRFLGAKWRAEVNDEQQAAELPAQEKPAELAHKGLPTTDSPVELQGSDQWDDNHATTYLK